MKIVASSDLHGYLPAMPPCDLLLLGGDLCPDGSPSQQADWLDTKFRFWLKSQPAKHIVAVAGNHDWVFQDRPDLVPRLPWKYLLDVGTTIEGLKIWGSPWQPVFFDWAFNLTEPELAKKWELIPDDTDILLLHGPPYQHGDRTSRGNHTGSPSLTATIERIQPRLVVCGHIHEARGEYRIGDSRVVNASQLDLRYEPYLQVFEMEWER
jgi:Icc-related predicted phosphoesterase